MDTAIIFHWYTKFIWPLQRCFVKKIKRCKKCILSEKYTTINKNGICKQCQDFNIHCDGKDHSQSTNDLSTVIQNYISNKQYDATLLLSGGKDSAYILHRLKIDYPELKILCLIINNGFLSSWATKNAKYTTQKLNVDLIIVNSYVEKFKATFRQAFLDLNKQGTYGVIDYADGNVIFEAAENITRAFGISLMIGGLSWVQLQHILNSTDFQLDHNGVKCIYPLAVWRTDEQDIRKYVKDHQLLIKGSDNPVVSNNRLIPIMSALDIKNLGYSSFEPEFAQLIREGKSSRNVWLPVFESLNYVVKHKYLDKELKQTLAELNLTLEEVL